MQTSSFQQIHSTAQPSIELQNSRALHPSAEDMDLLQEIIALGRARVVTEGTAIHRVGDSFRAVFFIKSGMAKRVLVKEDGREQILAFPMPGDLLGLEAIDAGGHSTSVVALDLCALVEIPFAELESLVAKRSLVARFLYCRMSAALRDEHNWLVTLGVLNADEKMAVFFLDLSRRFAVRGFSNQRFTLQMTRSEIGRFLGLTLETVSRVFSRFQKLGLIKVTLRDIELMNLPALHALAQQRSQRCY